MTHHRTDNTTPQITVNAGNYDPTRTLTLRRRFSGQMTRRFRKIKGAVRTAVIQRHVLGTTAQIKQLRTQQDDMALSNLPEPVLPGEQAFTGQPGNARVQDFMDWLKRQEDRTVLEQRNFAQIATGVLPWVAYYIYLAYLKGVHRARSEMRALGYTIPERFEYDEVNEEFVEEDIQRALQQEQHRQAFELLYGKAYTELQGAVAAMNQQVSRVVTDSLLQRKPVTQIADDVNERIDKVGLYRGRLISRTETIRTFNTAMLREMEQWGVEQVTAEVEYVFRTSHDNRVCSICAGLEGTVYTIEEAEGVLPIHPACRCVFVPRANAKQKEREVA